MRFSLPLFLVGAALAAPLPGVGLAQECPKFVGEPSELVDIRNAHNGELKLGWAGEEKTRLIVTYPKALLSDTLSVSLDGKDITERFSPGDEGERFDIIPLEIPKGEYTLMFSGYTEGGEESYDFSGCNPMPMEWQRFTIIRSGPDANVGNINQGPISAEEARRIRQERGAQ